MPINPQEKFTTWLWRFALVFFFLYITTLTFEYYLIEWWFDLIGKPFRWLAEQTGMLFFGVNLLGAEDYYSDSLLVYVHLFDLLLIAFVVATVWTILLSTSTTRHSGQALSLTRFTDTKFYPFLLALLRYFLALNLLVYGFSKLYKWQFMLPEPNILYTRVGDMHRDILYWTSMGSSRPYTMFMGMVEIIPAILLLFRRTTLIGAFAALLVMTNVVAVNFGFDITVKLHSTMLLIMSLVILIPGRKRIVALFTGKAAEEWKYPAFVIAEQRKWISPVVKAAVVLLLLAESHYPYTKTGIYNDDVSERPAMHGAYEVIAVNSVIANDDVSGMGEKMIFIHRRGYIIFQKDDESFKDYPVTIDTLNKVITYNNRSFGWSEIDDSTYYFAGTIENRYVRYTVRRVDVSKMPLMQEEFTWIDEE